MPVLLLAFLIGVIAGLRALTAPAVVAWAGFRIGFLQHTPFVFMGRLPAAIVFTVLAILELVTDVRPGTPSRLAPPGLIARIVTGGLCGACLAAADAQSIVIGILLGVAGGVVGAFAGYHARKAIVQALKTSDLPIALLEDAIAIAGAIFIVSQF